LFKYIIDFPCVDRAHVKMWCRLKYADSEYSIMNSSRELILVLTYEKG